MKAMVVPSPGGPFTLVDRETPEPGPGEVRLKVAACGVCHADRFVKEGTWHGLQYPRVPGHEVVGTADKIGPGVTTISVGQRLGIGWHGGHDGACRRCAKGDFLHCQQAKITGMTFDGGYAEYLTAPSVAFAPVPAGMNLVESAPLLCAGVTTFNSLRNSGARSGDLVAVQGLGGLGHLGLQYARAMGFEVVALSRGDDKEPLARDLGAHHYVDVEKEDPAKRLEALGGAQVIMATAPNSKAIASLVAGLGVGGCLLVLAAAFGPMEVNAVALISGRRRIQGWPSGTPADSADCLAFSHLQGIRARVEVFPLERAGEGYERMASGAVRFRSVISG